MKSTENVPFRLLVTPCCGTMLCWVNPRFPSFCPECGVKVIHEIRGCVTHSDPKAMLIVDMRDFDPRSIFSGPDLEAKVSLTQPKCHCVLNNSFDVPMDHSTCLIDCIRKVPSPR